MSSENTQAHAAQQAAYDAILSAYQAATHNGKFGDRDHRLLPKK